jgi:hypothetical protein
MGAWQPFTGAGLAAFGHGSASRLLFCQLFFVALGAIAVGVGVRQAWFTTVVQSERSLPDGTAEIRAGRLTWPDREPRALGETPQFALTVDPTSQGALGQVADLQLELRESALRIRGVAGFIEIPYGENWRIPLDRIGGKAQWQAWAWVIQGLAAVTGSALLPLFWYGIAFAFALPVWILAYALGRNVTLVGSWKILALSWAPASLVLDLAVVLYAFNWIRLTGLAVLLAVFASMGILWLIWALAEMPTRGAREPENPFRN